MSLLALQFRFAQLLPLLLTKAHDLGYSVTMGETWRSTATARINAEHASGVVSSLHCDRLAVDLNLFRGAEYLTDGEAHRELGAYWKSLDPAARWGGDIVHPRPDGNHYSLSPDGRRA